MLELKEGEKFETFVNPFATQHLFVRDAKGRYIGLADRSLKPCRADFRRVTAAKLAAVKTEASLLRELRERQAPATKTRTARAKHNTELLKAEPARQADLAERAAAALNTANEVYEHTIRTTDDDSY